MPHDDSIDTFLKLMTKQGQNVIKQEEKNKEAIHQMMKIMRQVYLAAVEEGFNESLAATMVVNLMLNSFNSLNGGVR